MAPATSTTVRPRGAVQPPGQAPTPTGGPDDGGFLAGPHGPYLAAGLAADTAQRAERIAARHGLRAELVTAEALTLAADPVATLARHLRSAMWLRIRRRARVYEGRVQEISTEPVTGTARRLPPAAFTVTLATDDDQRRLHFAGAFARAFLASGARVGDVVQITQHEPLVTVRRDRAETTGPVLDLRDFEHLVRLADADRGWAPPRPPSPGREEEASDPPSASSTPRLAPARPLYGTGGLPTPGPLELARTDDWVDDVRARGEGQLEPGVLALLDAGTLPPPALAVLRDALASGTAPIVVLHDADRSVHERWMRLFPTAVPDGAWRA